MVDKMADLSCCCVCLERLRSPMNTLPCLHSACAACLHLLILKGKKPFHCPLCRAEFEVPEEAADELKQTAALPPNYFSAYLLAAADLAANQEGFDPNSVKCEQCEKEDATEYCKNCSVFFCLECKKVHLRPKPMSHHQFISVDEALEVKAHPTRITRCYLHPQYEVNSYCTECKEACCSECSVDFHPRHDIVRMSTVSKDFKDEITALAEKVKTYDDELTQAIQNMSVTMSKVMNQTKEAKEHVRQMFEALKALLLERENQLLEEIEKEGHWKTKELMLQKEDLEFLLRGIRHAVDFSGKLVSDGSETEVIVSHKSVVARFNTLLGEKEVLEKLCRLSPVTNEKISLEKAEEGIASSKEVLMTVGQVATQDISSKLSKIRKAPQFALVNQQCFLEVALVDGNGEKVTDATLGRNFDILIEGPSKDIAEVSITDKPGDSGTNLVSFLLKNLGEYEVSLLRRGEHLQGSPFKFQVVDRMVCRRDYSKAGELSRRFGSNGVGDGQLNRPVAIVCNPQGEIFVAESNNHRVQVFDGDGRFLFKFGSYGSGNGQFNSPNGLTINYRSGNQIVLADTQNHRIQILSERGVFIRCFGTNGGSDGQFSQPIGVAVDPTSGNYLVADHGNHRIQVFNSEGKFIRKFGNGMLNGPWGIALLANGNLAVSEYSNNRIQIFEVEGKSLRVFGSGYISNPRHIFVDADDNILVSDYNNARIQVFNVSGGLLKTIGSGQLSGPAGVCMDSQGRIIVSEYSGHRISAF